MKKLKTSEVAALNAILKNANMNKGDVSAKLALVGAIIATKAIADRFNDSERITREKLQPEDFRSWQELAQKKDLSQQQILDINRYFLAYEKAVQDALRAEADKVVEVALKPWTDEQFAALLESNNGYTGAQMLLLHDALM